MYIKINMNKKFSSLLKSIIYIQNIIYINKMLIYWYLLLIYIFSLLYEQIISIILLNFNEISFFYTKSLINFGKVKHILRYIIHHFFINL